MGIREDWRTRIRAIVAYENEHGFDATDVEGWLDDWMQTPALALAELAESKREWELRVVEPIYLPNVLTKGGAEVLTAWAQELDPSLEVLPTRPIGYRIVGVP